MDMSTKQTEKMEVGIVIPENVKVRLAGHMLHVEGPLGKTHKNFKKIPVNITINNNKILIKASGTRKKHYAILNTATSLIQTLCDGVIDGYTVKMKIVFFQTKK